jgi:hypothetical protein
VRDPGLPSFDPLRYAAFRRIQSRANDAYDPTPAAFPATLVVVGGSDALERCRPLIPDLVLREMGGIHETVLAPPHVEELAAVVAGTAHDFLASNSEKRSVEGSRGSGAR